MSKNWYKSRTIWLGICTVATAALTALLQGENWQTAALAAIGALTVILRLGTNAPILKGADKRNKKANPTE